MIHRIKSLQPKIFAQIPKKTDPCAASRVQTGGSQSWLKTFCKHHRPEKTIPLQNANPRKIDAALREVFN